MRKIPNQKYKCLLLDAKFKLKFKRKFKEEKRNFIELALDLALYYLPLLPPIESIIFISISVVLKGNPLTTLN